MKQEGQIADMIVVGGGAAGFFTALRAAELAPDSRVIILEGSAKTLNKVRISGGGRCNLTHACWDPAELVTHYPRGNQELLGPFHKFAPGDTIDWFEKRGVETKIEEDGRMFPVSDQSESVAACLEGEAKKKSIHVNLSARVNSISHNDDGFQVTTTAGDQRRSRFLVVATGGQTSMWKILGEMGHSIIPPVPSLFTFHIQNRGLHKLSGISVPNARIWASSYERPCSGPLLITHQGLSGPAVLQLSAWAARAFYEQGYQTEIRVDWTGRGAEWGEAFIQESREVSASRIVAARGQSDLPQRLWQWMVARSGIPDSTRWADLTSEQMAQLKENLSFCSLRMISKSTYKEEFVTAGGVSLKEIDFRTFESRIIPGLFLAGEVLDIDAVTGGFNFQAAWTGGWLAGTALGGRIRGDKI